VGLHHRQKARSRTSGQSADVVLGFAGLEVAMAYGVNKGKSQVEALKNWETGLRDIAAKASDLGGIQGGVDAVEGFYANAPAQLQQQQNQGLFALRQQAGDAAGMLAGRGGASNAMSSSAASAQSAAMASGVGQFMGDIAAQRSNLAFQSAQSNSRTRS